MHKRTFLLALGVMLVLGLGRIARAQIGDQPYRLNDRQVEQLIHNIERQSDTFRKSLDNALDKSRFDRTRREDSINAYVRDFENEIKRLHDHFDHHKSTSGDVQSVLDRAARIDQFMSRNRLTARAQNDWSGLRANLDRLAEAYNVSWRWDAYSPNGAPVSDIPYRLSDKDVEQIIHRLEQQSDKFRSTLDSALDRSRLNGTRREDDINAFVKDFYKETKRLHDHFDNHKSTSADVQLVLDRAARIDQFMARYPLTRQAQNDWSALKAKLDELARAYNVTWGWSGSNPLPGPIPVDQPVIAVITSTPATNRRGYRISLAHDGRAEVTIGGRTTSSYVPQYLSERFFADLEAARPLSQLPAARPCFKSASFGNSTYVNYGGDRSPDLSCATGARTMVLRDDVAAIEQALNLYP